MIRTILLFAGAIALSAATLTRNAQDSADRAVRAQLRDPGSAVFRGVAVSPRGDVCGEVDSRNIEGGRTGFARFVYNHRSGKVVLALHDPDFHQFFVMEDNEYTNGNALVIINEACAFVESWATTCPSYMAQREHHALSLCALYEGGGDGKARLKKLFTKD